MGVITVGISDLKIAKAPDVLATYALGSCVGIALRDQITGIGGLAHIMLPWSVEATDPNANPRRYADTGILELIEKMCRCGAKPGNFLAKIAGGAQMFESKYHSFNIGQRNVEAVKRVLSDLKIRITAEDTGLNFGRTVFFVVENGDLQIKAAAKNIKVI
ncbi:MAG: chemotaxis protein CheD [Oscillospiraceae bacterium]